MAVYQSRIGVARDKIKILVHHGTEPDFIINYDIKYRMGDELNAGGGRVGGYDLVRVA